jgi:BirA family transcriptional regulator, biotin operon repressor / biotin---[acetyl-CoA-carboxylase] ligase
MSLDKALRIHLETVDSTNLHAARLSKHGESLPFWVTSDEQTTGRGRSNHRWISEPGNLYASVAFEPDCAPSQYPQLGLVAAVAVFDTVSKWVGTEKIKLKWPNDCLVEGAKISGILIEALCIPSTAVVVGCGVNVVSKPSNNEYPTTALHDYNTEATTEGVFETLKHQLNKWLAVWGRGSKFSQIREEWLLRAKCDGQRLLVTNGATKLDGTCRGLNTDGALLLEKRDGSIAPVYAGDVRIAI